MWMSGAVVHAFRDALVICVDPIVDEAEADIAFQLVRQIRQLFDITFRTVWQGAQKTV